jgi:porphobilinogen synthase
MDPPNVREGVKEALADIEEGADMVMVKPALAYLDVIRAVKERTHVPVAAYNVSGEYAMVEFAAKAGALDRERIISEVLVSIKRAGADLILTYHAVEVAGWLK